MKKAFILLLLLCSLIPLLLVLVFQKGGDGIVQRVETAVQSQDLSGEDKNRINNLKSGYVQLWTGDKYYDGLPHWVNGYDGKVYADGSWFGGWAAENNSELQTAMADMADIPYADDFKIKCVWEYDPDKLITGTYAVFDESLNQLSNNEQTLEIPPENGTYYVAVYVSWGVKDNYSGYQYIFKIVRR